MGCCIGKLKKGSGEHEVHDHKAEDVPVDKEMVTQSPIMSPSTVTYSSSYSLSPAKSLVPSSLSLLPLSSSASSLKDRTFSNQFLIRCLNENPQVMTPLHHHIRPSSPTHSKVFEYRRKSTDHPTSERRSFGQRREWQTSHSAVRQKTPNFSGPSGKAALLQTPSPSRRFNNNVRVCEHKNHNVKRAGCGQKGLALNDCATNTSVVFSKRHHRGCSGLKLNADSLSVSAQSCLIEEMECMMSLEDVDNPLISLDCFIFL
ncbi:unnamed protein product [Rhodiola kirilowii]